MVQARRVTKRRARAGSAAVRPRAAARRAKARRLPRAALAMLVTGVVIGALGTSLWQGITTAKDGVGAGIRQLLTDRPAPPAAAPVAPEPPAPAAPGPPRYDFFTILPGMEVVEPEAFPEAPVQEASPEQVSSAATALPSTSAYMLQVGAYRDHAEAEHMRTTMLLNGMTAEIQKVTIHGRGDFFRVRLGPYLTYEAMVKADQRLKSAGIQGALRLKVSGPSG